MAVVLSFKECNSYQNKLECFNNQCHFKDYTILLSTVPTNQYKIIHCIGIMVLLVRRLDVAEPILKRVSKLKRLVFSAGRKTAKENANLTKYPKEYCLIFKYL